MKVAIAETAERCEFLQKAFATMPPQHRDCLEFLMFHLTRVAKREPENLVSPGHTYSFLRCSTVESDHRYVQMSPKNLSVVFAPTIMRDTSLEREMTDMHAKNLAVQFVIENSDTIFAE